MPTTSGVGSHGGGPWSRFSSQYVDRPFRRRRAGHARQGESRRQDVLAEARVRVLRIEGIDQQRQAPLDRSRRQIRIQSGAACASPRAARDVRACCRKGSSPATSRAASFTPAPATGRATLGGRKPAEAALARVELGDGRGQVRRPRSPATCRGRKQSSAYALSQSRKSLSRRSPPVRISRSTSGADLRAAGEATRRSETRRRSVRPPPRAIRPRGGSRRGRSSRSPGAGGASRPGRSRPRTPRSPSTSAPGSRSRLPITERRTPLRRSSSRSDRR